MLTTATKVKMIAFGIIGVLVIAYISATYANLSHLVGYRGYFVVKMELAEAGGIFPNAEVAYRGVTIGRVGAVNLTDSGVEVDLNIKDGVQVPTQLNAAVANRSAVGEQYVDLRPNTADGPFLQDNSVIPQSVTSLPPPVQGVLTGLDKLAASVPAKSLQTVVDELYNATNGQGPNLQTLLDSSSQFVGTALTNIQQTTQLINASQQVLKTQNDENNSLNSFSSNSALIAQQLIQSDTDIRRLIAGVPEVANQVTAVLQDTNPSLSVLLANLLTTADVTVRRQPQLRELLSDLPTAVSIGSSIIRGGKAQFGESLTFFDPLPCTAGYGGTAYRNALDTSPGSLNTAATCTMPPPGGELRGAGAVPNPGLGAPAVPGSVTFSTAAATTGGQGLPGALGLGGLPGGPTSFGGLLGL
jgi:phospholipid/cholesterol/gamma-HCH transport system substrate-binding protein